MKRLVVLAGLLLLAACGQNQDSSPECRPQCAGRACGDDGCGGSCGSCSEGWLCSPTTFSCTCPAEDDAAFCRRMGRVCGSASGEDLCGHPRTVSCDLCPAPTRCAAATDRCECTAESDEAFCARLGDVCGTRTAPDDCGAERTVDCECAPDEVCSPSTQTCRSCDPETDERFCGRMGKICGRAMGNDNCLVPRSVDCAFCDEGRRCDPATETCVCAPESDAQFCEEQGRQCGPANGHDRCGRPRHVDSCGHCAGTDECNEATGGCDPCRPESKEAFCARQEKVCGDVDGLDNCLVVRSVNCGTCGNGKTCTDNLCAFPGGPTNDDCSSPTRVAIVNGTGTLSGSLDQALGDMEATCGRNTGGDVVYAFTLTQPQQVQLDLLSAQVLSVSVRSACGDAASEVACAEQSNGSLSLGVLAAGTWYLWVDASAPGVTGSFSATLRLSPPPPVPANDSCSTPAPISFIGTSASVPGTTLGAHDDRAATCAGAPGVDVFYAFELVEPASLKAVAWSRGTVFLPVLSVLSACGGPTVELRCAMLETAAIGRLAAGNYLIAVDSSGPTPGDFVLELEVGPPVTNDTCAAPQVVDLDLVTKAGIAYSDTGFGSPNAVNSCDPSNAGPDLVFQFEVPPGDNQNVQLTATAAPGSSFRPQLSVRTACDQVSAELGCDASYDGTNGLLLTRLPAGTYYVWVDGGTRYDFGPFSLAIQLTTPTPPDNDLCATAEELTLDPATGVAIVEGTTAAASDDTAASCGGVGGDDVAYWFTLQAPARVSATVTRKLTSGSFQPTVYVRSVCDRALLGDEKGCATGASGIASVVIPNLSAGDWYVIVDGANGSQGDFDLEVSAVPVVSNFTCASAQALSFARSRTVVVRSDTTNGQDRQTTSTCAALVSGGNEVVFSFAVPPGPRQDVTLEATKAPGTMVVPVVSVRRNCEAPASEIGCAADGPPTASLSLPSLGEGTYYIWIDTPSSHANGPFTLTVTMTDAASAPANEGCAAPEPIVIDTVTGIGTASGDTALAGPDETGSCSALDGRDLVYAFTLDGASDVQVDAAALPGSAFDPVVYLRSSCADAASERGCAAAFASGSASLLVPRLAAGVWYLVVDSASGLGSGAFSLQVSASLATPLAANDRCQAAQAIRVDPSTQALTLTGSTLAGLDDESGGCAAAGHPHSGADVVYALALDDAARVVVTVTGDATTPGYRPAVYLAQSCAATGLVAGELACGNDSGGVARANAREVAAGQVFIVVDGEDGTAGRFTLTVKVGAPGTNDTCASPLPVAMDPATQVGIVYGDTSDVNDDERSSCNNYAATGKDLIYSFVVPPATTKDVAIEVSGVAPMQPTVSVRSDCRAMGTELGCVLAVNTTTSSIATVGLVRVTAGTYYILVDGLSAVSNGEFAMRVSMVDSAPGPANDTCAAPQSIVPDLATGKVTVTGATRASANDYSGSCGSFTGGDNVYRVHLDAPAKLTAKVTPDPLTSTDYYPAAYLRASCDSPASADERACAKPQSGLATLTASVLGAGDYFLFVDGAVGTSGDYTLEVQVSAPLYGENCLGAEPLPFAGGTAVVNADTTSSLADSDGTCGGDHGPDRVYSFTTTAVQSFWAEMVFATNPKPPTIYLRSSCGDPSTEIACAAGNAYSNRARIDIARLPAGTWYLWADSNSSMSTILRGPFTLTVNLAPPPAPPVNDVCAGAEELQFNQTTHKATVTAQTTYALDDYDGSCANANGPDVVYTFTTNASQQLTVRVTPSATTPAFKPVVYLRSDCDRSDASNELSCATKDLTSGFAELKVNDLRAASYWIVVDGAASGAGAFTLDVELSAPVAGPANESCASVEVLRVTGDALQVTATTRLAQNDAAGSCGGGSAPDVVYSIGTSSARKIVATVTPSASFYPAVYIRSSCDAKAPGAELACASSGGSATAATAIAKNAPAGTYWIWVDSSSGSSGTFSGAFTLDLRLEPPVLPPANDDCAAPAVLAPGTTLTGDTSDASNDFGAFTSSRCSSTLVVTSPDVVYVFTPASTGSYTVTVTPTTSWDVVVWVGSGICGGAGSCVVYGDAGGGGAAESVSFTGAGGQPYYVFVEGFSATSAGPFTIAVH